MFILFILLHFSGFIFGFWSDFNFAKLVPLPVLFWAWRSIKRFHQLKTIIVAPKMGFLGWGKLQMIYLLCERCLSKLGHPVPLKSWMLFPRMRV